MTKEEYGILKEIYYAASDYILGVKNEEFAEQCGGAEKLFQAMKDLVEEYDENFNQIIGE